LIQRRSSGPKEEFYRNWTEYENGFGNCSGNNWIGLKTINALTSPGNQELRIDMEDWDGVKKYAQYSTFSISNATDSYRLNVSGYLGNAGDYLKHHNGMKFSTNDKENDEDRRRNCAQEFHGGWWYKRCSFSNLNGYYYEKDERIAYDGIIWGRQSWGGKYSLTRVEMKIRDRR